MKKKKLKVKVVGCGGVGLCLLNVLPRYLNYLKDHEVELTLIDGDSFDESNKTRQSFSKIGNKAEVTAEKIRSELKNILCWVTGEYLTEENIFMVIREGDVVFGCVDNHATRKLISDRCSELNNATFISGGNEYTDGNVQIHVRKDGKDLTLPVASKYHPEISNPADHNPGDVSSSCEVQVVSQPQLLIANNMVAACMLCAFYGWMEGVHEQINKSYDEAYFDVKLNKVRPVIR